MHGYIYDIIFIFESNLPHLALPKIDGYTVFSNPENKYCKHGGIAMYIKDNISSNIFDITYNECFMTFRLDFTPERMFGGVYIQPEGSKYYSDKMFADFDQELLKCCEHGYIPFIGGDFNSRLGNLNTIAPNTWKYEDNCDITTNNHGRTLLNDICKRNKIYPINHLKYKGKVFNGDFTYIKNDKKSQIDYVITNNQGRSEVVSFQVIKTNWHISDHRPIALEISFNVDIRCDIILARAQDLNHDNSEDTISIKRFRKEYHLSIMNDYMTENKDQIERDITEAVEQNDIDSAVEIFNMHIAKIHLASEVKYKKVDTSAHTTLMKDANIKFQDFLAKMHEGKSVEANQAMDLYIDSRKKVTRHMMSSELKEWTRLTSEKKDNELWRKIDWKGEMSKNNNVHPPINELKEHFQGIYSLDEKEPNINTLSSDVYIPILDDPITTGEIEEGMKKCKKGGYDFPITSMKNFLLPFMSLIGLILNAIFYGCYPIKLACSLLFSIPKKGNLHLPKNFRGIQMLPTLGVLYDRILYGRLEKWLNIHNEQTGFQKGKSTTHQIFTIRLLIALAKYMKITLYIGCFDVEKAFDKVSRYLLLKKLISYGIGYHMLNALKAIYSKTSCILSMKGIYSTEFPTESGIRQGAASSSLLFVSFINDLIDFIRNKCDPEPLIESLHCLLHADDTLLLSTSRELFCKKCNVMNEYFDNNQLKLNLGKSGYLIINGKKNHVKSNIELDKGTLDYKKEITYLGIIINDNGNLRQDITSSLAVKRSNITIKYTNFCAKNFLAPLSIKLKVLRSCVVSSLLYSCETWSQYIPKSIEVTYRIGIKTALGIRNSCCNEVLYVESGLYPLQCEIKKRQLQFWKMINSDENRLPYIQRLTQLGVVANIPFIKYYMDLEEKYITPRKCIKDMRQDFISSWKTIINDAYIKDANSPLGSYLIINPLLSTPNCSMDLLEYERIIITKLRTGTHNLFVEAGRYTNPRIPRDERKCLCNTGIQTVEHVLLKCPSLQHLRRNDKDTVSSYIESEYILDFIIRAAGILKFDL